MKMLGYMSARDALADGYTHHGRIFGVPVWLAHPDSNEPRIAAKWVPLDALIFALAILFNALPLPAAGFPIAVGREIDR